METQAPDLEACRELFTELEFTSMLRDLAPADGGALVEVIEEPTAEQAAEFYAGKGRMVLRLRWMRLRRKARRRSGRRTAADHVAAGFGGGGRKTGQLQRGGVRGCRYGAAGSVLRLLTRTSGRCIRPKSLHDWKLALHVLDGQGVELRGAVEDTMLLSYALNPTHATQALADVAARHGQGTPSSSQRRLRHSCAGSDAACRGGKGWGGERFTRRSICRWRRCFIAWSGPECASTRAYWMGFQKRFTLELERVGERIFELAGRRFNINSPKQLGEVLFTNLGLPAPASRGRARRFPQRRMCWRRGGAERGSAPGAGIPALIQAEVELYRRCRCWPMRIRGCTRRFRRRQRRREGCRRQSESAEYSHSHGIGARDSSGVYGFAGDATAFGGLLAD
jgi:DNA polymerase-1